MTEEIKENNIPNNVLQALGDLTNGAINYYQLPKTTLEEENIILNYITNLQKENERLRMELNGYKLKCEKADEYIKQHCDKPGRLLLPKIDFNYNDLSNILKGGDE